MTAKTHVRCGTPDCDWGTPLPSNEDQLSRCRVEFREHCIERHGLNPEDTERICWFNLELLTMTLVPARRVEFRQVINFMLAGTLTELKQS
jgi:hypothetical protein